jgi:hypothetical protein
MNLQSEKTREPLKVTWAGKYSEHLRSFQSSAISFPLTFPFIERANWTNGVLDLYLSGKTTYQDLMRWTPNCASVSGFLGYLSEVCDATTHALLGDRLRHK